MALWQAALPCPALPCPFTPYGREAGSNWAGRQAGRHGVS